jgi:protein involved in temperature-dependent protein secretion
MANYLLRKNEIEKAIQQYKDIIERNPSKNRSRIYLIFF